MSETVQIALITFLASISSAIIGASVTIKSSERTASFKAKEALYAKKIEVYSSFFSAYHSFVALMAPGPAAVSDVGHALHDLAKAYSFAALIAPNDVASSLFDLFSLCTDYSKHSVTHQEVAKQYGITRNALHADLEKTRPK